MFRAVLSVIAGYAVMFIFIFLTFTIAMLAMGVERTYQPVPSWDVSTLWLVVSFVLGLIAAILGGCVCALLSRATTPPKVLAGLVLALGLMMAVPTLLAGKGEPPPPRTADVSPFKAMQYSKEPAIVLILNPIIGCVGVLIGARCVRRPDAAPQS